MVSNDKREVWQRGPVEGVPALLQPVAHALLQAREEVVQLLTGFPEAKLWEKPAGVASVAFHLQHLTGVLDRLFTYAGGQQLTAAQLESLSREGQVASFTVPQLVNAFNEQIDKAIDQLKNAKEQSLVEPRGVGRAQIPSTVIGLLFHAAEHTMRHIGQLHVTAKVLIASQ